MSDQLVETCVLCACSLLITLLLQPPQTSTGGQAQTQFNSFLLQSDHHQTENETLQKAKQMCCRGLPPAPKRVGQLGVNTWGIFNLLESHSLSQSPPLSICKFKMHTLTIKVNN